MKYYFDLLSQPSRALWIFMKLNDVPFEPVVIKLARNNQKTAEFAEVNRFKQVPCIDDDGFKLSETVAIFRYLMAKHPEIADHWYPKDARERARIDEYLEWQHNEIRSGCTTYVRVKFVTPMERWPRWKGASERRLAETKENMEKALDKLETIWLANESQQFLASNEISFADIFAFCEIESTKLTGYDPYAGRPNLNDWQKRVREKTNPVCEEAHAANSTLAGYSNSWRIAQMLRLYFSYNY